MGETTDALIRREPNSEPEDSTETPVSLLHEGTQSETSLLPTSLSVDSGETKSMEIAPLGAEDPDSLRAQIEQTRSEMSETLEAIKTKLDPHVLMEEAKDKVYEATIGKAAEALDTAKEVALEARNKLHEVKVHVVGVAKRNPVPMVVVGAVLGWVLLRAWSKRRNRTVVVCD